MIDKEVLEYHLQPVKMALRTHIGNAENLANTIDFTKKEELDKLRKSQTEYEQLNRTAGGLHNQNYYANMARKRELEANLHLSAVQVLNDSLPDSTAEQDCAQEDSK